MMQKVDMQIDPVRGNIYDKDMKPLAQTITEYELYGYTQYLYKSSDITEPQRNGTVVTLARLTGQKKEDVKKILESEDNLVLIGGNLEQADVEEAKAIFGDNVIVKTKVSRSYPNGTFASHILGCVNEENSGRIGLEYQYNEILAGVPGRVVRTTDRDGNTLSQGSTRYYPAEDGYSVVTTLDSVVQSYVEDEIAAGQKYYNADSVSCIVMETKTGNILAMATTPGFDPNNAGEPVGEDEKERFSKLSYQEQSEYLSRMWTNGCISSLYEPGSTFKLITASSALDSGTIGQDYSYNCKNYINVDGVMLYCLNYHTHGKQTLTEAVANSCNTAHAQMALDMGIDTYYNYLNLYGMTDITGIDLPGEASPLVKDKKTIHNVDFATMGYGQGISITPIQLVTAVSVIGNDGKLMKPKLVKRIIDSNGDTVEEIPDTVVRQVISEESAHQMCDVMLNAVEDGGGSLASVPGYRVGGKTGTADIPGEHGGYSGAVIASFIGMAPMDNPDITVVVIVNNPKRHGTYGSVVAAPIAGRIIEKTLEHRGVERVYAEGEEEATTTRKDATVPDVVGMNSEAAKSEIWSYGLRPVVMPESTEGRFQVVAQNPAAGTKVEYGSNVYIYSE